MNKKNFLLTISLVTTLIATNVYWAFKWIDVSINVKSADFDLSQCEQENESHVHLIKMLINNKTKDELEAMLLEQYGNKQWSMPDSLNTEHLKFIYRDNQLKSVVKQTEINPNDKG